MGDISKADARLMAKIQGTHGGHLTLFGRTFSVTYERDAGWRSSSRFGWWWY